MPGPVEDPDLDLVVCNLVRDLDASPSARARSLSENEPPWLGLT